MKKFLLTISACACLFATNAQTLYADDFNDVNLDNWSNLDNDADPSSNAFDKWAPYDIQSLSANHPDLGSGSAISASRLNSGALTPDNLLVSPLITIPSGLSNVQLNFKVGSIYQSGFEEHYAIYVTTANDLATIIGSTPVLEETLSQPTNITNRSVDMNAYVGMDVYVTIRHYMTTNKGIIVFDEVSVRNVLQNDAAISKVILNRYAEKSTDNTLSVEVKNVGASAISSVEVNWNDGTNHSAVITTNIAAGSQVTIPHTAFVNYATAVEKIINVEITAVNGGTDDNMTDNQGTAAINTVSSKVAKSVLMEEGTGTWCQFCPRGAVVMDFMTSTYPDNFIGIAVHNADPMVVTAYDAAADFPGYPTCNIDRALLGQSLSQGLVEGYYNSRKDMIVPAAISATLSLNGRNATINATSNFVTPFAAANYRLAVVIMEDGVTGTTSGYNQVNAYAGGGLGPMGGYESLPNPVPAAQMVYDHVGRALLGGYDGQTGSVPTTIADGQAASYTFNYAIPNNMDGNDMYAVVMLIDQATGEVVNSKSFKMPEGAGAVGIEENSDLEVSVYPNPATDFVKVSFEAMSPNYDVTITDMAGKVVSVTSFTNLSGAQTLNVPTSELLVGNYLITLSTDGVSFTKHLSIK